MQPLGIFGSSGASTFDGQENLAGGSIVDRPPRSRQPVVISLPKSTVATDQFDNNNTYQPAFANYTYNNNNSNTNAVDTFEGLNLLFFCFCLAVGVVDAQIARIDRN